MPTKYTYEQVKQEFAERGYELLSTEFHGTADRLEYICPKHRDKGVLTISFQHFHYNKRGCWYCGHESTARKKRVPEDVIKTAAENLGWEFIGVDYTKKRTSVKVICPEHREHGVQDVWWYVIQQGYKRNTGCKYCAHNVKLTHAEFEKRVREQLPHVQVLSRYIDQKHKVTVHCDKHNITWDALPTTLYKGVGCAQCHRDILSQIHTIPRDARINELAQKNPTISLISEETRNGFGVTFQCGLCGRQWTTKFADSYYTGRFCCPYCAVSHGERRIFHFLEQQGIQFVLHKNFSDLRGVGNRPLSYDFYLPETSVLIEYQGQFHDGTVNFQTTEMFQRQVEHDRRKREYAKSHGYRLLEIWYWDFDRIPEILSQELNLNPAAA